MGLACEHTNGTSLGFHYYKTIDGTNTSIFDTYPLHFSTGIWAHFTMCYDGTKFFIYKDGSLLTSGNANKSNIQANMNTLYLFGGVANNSSQCSLNDVRIYDHCLSAAEVHEIAQGLALHYKLSDIPNPNLLPATVQNVDAWTADGSTKGRDGSAITFQPSSGNLRIYIGTSNVWTTVGAKFTVSLDAKADANGRILKASRSCADYGQNMSLTTTWQHYTSIITVSATSSGGTLSLQGPSGSTIWVRNVKVEAGEIATPFNLAGNDIIVQDSSGYNHNGITIGNPITSSSSSRYGAYISFDGSSDAINAGLDFEVEKALNFTFCAWIYSDRWNTGVNDYFLSSQESGGFLIRTLSGNTIRVRVNAFTATDYSANSYIDADATLASIGITTAGWHFVAGVYTTSNLKLYVDGVLRTTNTITTYGLHFNGSTNLFLGAECAGSKPTTFCKCGLSDVRIYYTALTADDILALYHTGAKVDNKQNLHAFELVENNSKIQITKQGQVKCNELEEDAQTKFYQIDQIIETNEIIEL